MASEDENEVEVPTEKFVEDEKAVSPPHARWQRRFVGVAFEYSDNDRTAHYKQHVTDLLVAVMSKVLAGTFLWEFNIVSKNDEMWIGVSSNSDMFEIVNDAIRNEDGTYSYYGGRESAIAKFSETNEVSYFTPVDGPWGCLNIEGAAYQDKKLKPYRTGDTVGLLVDVPGHSLTLYHNGEEQIKYTQLPTDKPLYLYAVLDSASDDDPEKDVGDRITLSVKPKP